MSGTDKTARVLCMVVGAGYFLIIESYDSEDSADTDEQVTKVAFISCLLRRDLCRQSHTTCITDHWMIYGST